MPTGALALDGEVSSASRVNGVSGADLGVDGQVSSAARMVGVGGADRAVAITGAVVTGSDSTDRARVG